MGLKQYFSDLIKKVETSNVITNAGKDDNGFYKPTQTIVLRHLNLLRDLHDKPRAKAMVKTAWNVVIKEIPPEWLILNGKDKEELKSILDLQQLRQKDIK
ncbi:MAG: hypothetical protein H7Z71_02260 [Moraxellaceae bacterium]|nr:hypothetical protein [Pseudobdellovibrionaceae bacterium]